MSTVPKMIVSPVLIANLTTWVGFKGAFTPTGRVWGIPVNMASVEIAAGVAMSLLYLVHLFEHASSYLIVWQDRPVLVQRLPGGDLLESRGCLGSVEHGLQ